MIVLSFYWKYVQIGLAESFNQRKDLSAYSFLNRSVWYEEKADLCL